MRYLSVPLALAVVVAGLFIAGCAPAAPPPAPTAAPAAPPKAAEPTRAPAAPTKPAAEPTKAPAPQPTAVPAAKLDYPAKGKAISIIVPYGVGGSVDLSSRLLAAHMQKELGNQFEIVNKTGAGGEVGTTAVAQARPDGYTLGVISAPGTNTIYLDPTRKSTFTRKDFALVGMHNIDIGVVVVTPNSPYKTINELVDAAKANPGKVRTGTSGLMTPTHLALLTMQNLTGAKFAVVHFDSGAESLTNLQGGHLDAVFTHVGATIAPLKNSQIRVLGVMDKKESQFLPGVKTMESQGIKLYGSTSRFLVAPSGVQKEMVSILTAVMKKVMDTDEHKKKMLELAQEQRYLDPAESDAYWDEWDVEIKKLLSQIR